MVPPSEVHIEDREVLAALLAQCFAGKANHLCTDLAKTPTDLVRGQVAMSEAYASVTASDTRAKAIHPVRYEEPDDGGTIILGGRG
jgi:hypothetical protein